MMRIRRMPALLVLCLLAAVPAAACDGDFRSGGSGFVGEAAPEFAAPTLDGDTIALADLRGEVVLVNVWATWCGPCREETPDLQALHEEYADDGLRILGVSVDMASAGSTIRQFTDRYGVTYDILHDPTDRVSNTFRVRGVPTSVLIDRDGMVVWRRIGIVHPDDQEFLATLEDALASEPAAS